MYRTIERDATIEMWPIQHNTIAGDVAVTTFIQVRFRGVSRHLLFPLRSYRITLVLTTLILHPHSFESTSLLSAVSPPFPPFSSPPSFLPRPEQGILTFVISSGMVHVDMRHGGISAFPFPWPDTRFGALPGKDPREATTTRQRLWRTFHSRHGLGRGLHFFSGSHVNDVFERGVGW
jgi:hypothetical protein